MRVPTLNLAGLSSSLLAASASYIPQDRHDVPGNHQISNDFVCGQGANGCAPDVLQCTISCENIAKGFYCDGARKGGYCICSGDADELSEYKTCPDGLAWDPSKMQCTISGLEDLSKCPDAYIDTPGPTIDPSLPGTSCEACANPPCAIECNLTPGFYCDLSDPAGYCVCDGDHSMYRVCPTGLFWDPTAKACNFGSSVDTTKCPNYGNPATLLPTVCGEQNCDGDKCDFVCNLDAGFYCDETDPGAYCFCTGHYPGDGRSTTCDLSSFWSKCPSGLAFDLDTKSCNFAAAVSNSCPEPQATVPPTTATPLYDCGSDTCGGTFPCQVQCDRPQGYYCDLNSPRGYCYCSGEGADLRNGGGPISDSGGKGSFYNECPEGLIFDPSREGCNFPGRVVDPVCPNEPNVDYVCGQDSCVGDSCSISCNLPWGYYCDDSDPSGYCFCSGSESGSRYVKCSGDLIWDPVNLMCNFLDQTDRTQC